MIIPENLFERAFFWGAAAFLAFGSVLVWFALGYFILLALKTAIAFVLPKRGYMGGGEILKEAPKAPCGGTGGSSK